MDTSTRRLPPGVTMSPGDNTFQIHILWRRNGWEVGYPAIPDIKEQDYAGNYAIGPAPFKPGNLPQWETMPLMEFLNMLADEYKLRHVLVANID
jgi:hypothetical protein